MEFYDSHITSNRTIYNGRNDFDKTYTDVYEHTLDGWIAIATAEKHTLKLVPIKLRFTFIQNKKIRTCFVD